MSQNLAVKALNQYRRRDIFPYLGLRYYLENLSARECRWVNEISCRLTIDSKQTSFLKNLHFKEYSEEGFIHRDIYLPAPNEALSETALITEISKYQEFQPKPYVYSYRFSDKNENNGVFKPYFDGFRERHRHIAKACRSIEAGSVLYTDIKKFYPSIRSCDALKIWEVSCINSGIDTKFRTLGRKILENHNEVSVKDGTGKGILTGPLFSHVIANLLLDETDTKMHEITGGKYWRYVDDVVLVGTIDEVEKWREILRLSFEELNLELHDGDKDFIVSCSDWLEGENDFESSLGKEWITLVSNVKRFLLANPSRAEELKRVFEKHHIRIPAVDYSNAVKESSYLKRFQDWRRKYRWSTKAVKAIDIEYLLKSAKECEQLYKLKIDEMLKADYPEPTYAKKRLIPKLRFLAGRLLYLSGKDELIVISNRLLKYPELFLIAKTMEAVATKNVTDILLMGVNATHVTSQLLRTTDSKVIIDNIFTAKNKSVLEQSLAVLEINGIDHDFDGEMTELRLLAKAESLNILMKSDEGFIREFACLYGILPSRHKKALDSSFDRDEELALDVLNQLQQSSHC